MKQMRTTALAAALAAVAACAPLEQGVRVPGLVQPPRFEQAPDQPAEIAFSGVTAALPAGGATIRIWAKVTNPNRFGLTLSTLQATLMLEGERAATGDFPLGLPLQPAQSTTVPLELSINFADMPALTPVARAALTGSLVEYQVDGTVGLDAGSLGHPTLGPFQLFRGQLRARRDASPAR